MELFTKIVIKYTYQPEKYDYLIMISRFKCVNCCCIIYIANYEYLEI